MSENISNTRQKAKSMRAAHRPTDAVASDKPNLKASDRTDLREQLFNSGEIGPIAQIQLPLARISTLRGLLFDLDPSLIKQGLLVPSVPTGPSEFYDVVAKAWISRHPVLGKCEIRDSGSGLHLILRLSTPVELYTDADRSRWAAIVQIVQSALPSDPRAPGITATTRALGSVNRKNGRKVSLIRKGEGVSVDELKNLAREMCERPFITLFQILTGNDRLSPCLKCKAEGTELQAGDHIGFCYGACRTVTLADLIGEVLI